MPGPASEDLLVGSRFGVYEVGECIGRGAMGQVYRAEHTLLKKAVALKIMASAARNSTTGHRRFTREARAAATIKHPNVVDILDMGVLDGLPFIVMELLEGEDLESYLARHGKLTERQLADLALPIIAAIGAVHDAGVVHRDIKPSNLFLAKGSEEDLVPKVLDFGISKTAKSLGDSDFVATGPGDLVGTPLYIAPEALKGAQYLTARSDQYSLGVVLYQCVVGRRPHEAKDLPKLVRSILSDPIEPLRKLDPSLSPELEAAVLRALSRNPEERFAHVRELGAALWALAGQRTRHVWAKRFSTSLAYSLPPGVQSAPLLAPRRRELRPVWAGLGAALTVLGTGYVVARAWPRTPAASPPATTVAAARGAAERIESTVLSQQPASAQPAAPGIALIAEPAPAQGARLGAPDGAASQVLEPAAQSDEAGVRPELLRQASSAGRGSAPRATRSSAVKPAGAAVQAASRPERRASVERRAPGTELDESSLLRTRRQPAVGSRAEPAPQLPRGANQSPILD